MSLANVNCECRHRNRHDEEELGSSRIHHHQSYCEPATHQVDICQRSNMNALLRSSRQALRHANRSFASSAHPDRKVALLGAAGGIGQPLGLLLKVRIAMLLDGRCPASPRYTCVFACLQISPYVSHLSLYDIAGTPGVAADISHINSKALCKVGSVGRSWHGKQCLPRSIRTADLMTH